ncbi:LamG domain-containing protein [Puia sp. P3]|uniref:LamG domain-containing protein n=1 Tax=Puia sp. P3 TaxID=3423952 RepID=UPI003D67FFAE
MLKQLTLSVAIAAAVITMSSVGCTKTPPPPPVHDTVTVIKKDTLTDTLYATKPDPTVNLTKGLLLYLPFSGNIADSSGNNNPTVASGSVLTYDAHGYANSAFGADGTGTKKIYVTNNGSIQFDTAYSVALGFMTNDTANAGTYISMIDPATGYGVTFNIGQTTTSYSRFAWGTEDVTLGCGQYGKNDLVNIVDTTNFRPVPGSWYKAVMIYHRGATQIYINGQLIYAKTGLGTLANLCPAAKIMIGAWWDSDPLRFNGKLDNIRLYNRVLTPHEIALLSSSYQVTSNSVRQVISR